MKVLISSCILGNNVRWNGANKLNLEIIEWAKKNKIELVPVCPEHMLLSTPRAPIRLAYTEEEGIRAVYKNTDVMQDLDTMCAKVLVKHKDAVGFIGIANSPTCGMNVGVRKLGRTIKGSMHKNIQIPATEINYLKTETNRLAFLKRLHENR